MTSSEEQIADLIDDPEEYQGYGVFVRNTRPIGPRALAAIVNRARGDAVDEVPASAAFLGMFYLVAVVMATLALRQPLWAPARTVLVPVVAFVVLVLVTTLLHLPTFHLFVGGTPARIAAWVWLAVYVVTPLGTRSRSGGSVGRRAATRPVRLRCRRRRGPGSPGWPPGWACWAPWRSSCRRPWPRCGRGHSRR